MSNQAPITLDDLLGMTDRVYDTVNLPNGQSVQIRSLNEDERTRYEFASSDARGRWCKTKARDARALLIAMSACDKNGRLLYTPEDLDNIVSPEGRVLIDLAPLHRLNGTVASMIYAGCLALHSGERIKQLKKKSPTTTGSDSPAGSHSAGESPTSAAGTDS